MMNDSTEDGSLWAEPQLSARRRRLKLLLIAVCVMIAVVLIVLHMIDYFYPHTVTNHAQANIGDALRAARRTV